MVSIGTIREIWRYPFKSMGGEKLESCQLGAEGIPGDRGWAVRDEKTCEIQGAKKIPKLLLCQARYLEKPTDEQIPPIAISLPGGRTITSDDAHVHAVLSEFVGKPVTIWPLQPAANREHYRRSQRTDDAAFRELLSREPDEPLPDLSAFPPSLVDELLEYVSPLGTYFDVAPLHLLTTASIATLSSFIPTAQIDARRFRPNFFIETPPDTHGFIEFDWCEKTVQLGEGKVICGLPVPRCGMTTHAQTGLPKDTSILRTIVKQVDQNMGIYGRPTAPGSIEVGDVVKMVD